MKVKKKTLLLYSAYCHVFSHVNQVQQQIFVCELKRCFFCIYTLKKSGCFSYLVNFQKNLFMKYLSRNLNCCLYTTTIHYQKLVAKKKTPNDQNEVLNLEAEESILGKDTKITSTVNVIHIHRGTTAMVLCKSLLTIPPLCSVPMKIVIVNFV